MFFDCDTHVFVSSFKSLLFTRNESLHAMEFPMTMKFDNIMKGAFKWNFCQIDNIHGNECNDVTATWLKIIINNGNANGILDKMLQFEPNRHQGQKGIAPFRFDLILMFFFFFLFCKLESTLNRK